MKLCQVFELQDTCAPSVKYLGCPAKSTGPLSSVALEEGDDDGDISILHLHGFTVQSIHSFPSI